MLSYSTGQCKFGKTFPECRKLLSKNIQLKIYRTIILSVFCMGVKLSHSYCGGNVGLGCLIIGC